MKVGKVVSLMHQLPLPPRKYSWFSHLLKAELTPESIVARRITSMKDSSNTIGNQACDAHTTVP